MPELPVKERRLPELHLPEITRQEILRTLSDVRRPDLRSPDDVGEAEARSAPREFALPKIDRSTLDAAMAAMPRIAAPTVDAARLMAGAMTVFRVGRRRMGPMRWGMVAGIAVTVAVAGIVIARDRATRERLAGTARGLTDRVTARRLRSADLLEVEPDVIEPAAGIAEAVDDDAAMGPVSEWSADAGAAAPD